MSIYHQQANKVIDHAGLTNSFETIRQNLLTTFGAGTISGMLLNTSANISAGKSLHGTVINETGSSLSTLFTGLTGIYDLYCEGSTVTYNSDGSVASGLVSEFGYDTPAYTLLPTTTGTFANGVLLATAVVSSGTVTSVTDMRTLITVPITSGGGGSVAGVTSVNNASGILTIAGSGPIGVETAGSTITLDFASGDFITAGSFSGILQFNPTGSSYGLKIANFSSLPVTTSYTSGDTGALILNTTDGNLYVFNGSAYTQVGGSSNSVNPRGTWSSSTTYAINDLVRYGTAQWISLQSTNLNQIPATGSWWSLFVQDGAVGATGTTGATGSTGATGAAGSNGVRGSLWYQGTGAPGTISGQLNNDLYLNTTTSDVYQLVSGTWTLIVNIKGATGSGGGGSGSSNFITRETPSGTMNGTNTTFTLANTPTTGSEELYLNGLLQDEGTGNDYTISTSTITMLVAPLSSDKLRVSYRM
jgi:hypothetical protein